MKIKYLTSLLFFTFCFSAVSFGQLIVKDQETPANTLLQVNDEGSAGSITLPAVTVGLSGNKLYNFGGNLFWGDIALGTTLSGGGWTNAANSIYNTTLTDRIGIGTMSPAVNLHVKGSNDILRLESSTTDGWISFYNKIGAVTSYKGYVGIYNGDDDIDIGTGGFNSTGNLNLVTQAIPRITIIPDGNVGIGTSFPGSLLSVGGFGGSSDYTIYATTANLSSTAIFGGSSVVNGVGVRGYNSEPGGIGVYGTSDRVDGKGIYGSSLGGYAGFFAGKTKITMNSSAGSPQLLIYEQGDDYGRIDFQNTNSSTNYWTIAAINSATNSSERFHIYNSTTGNILSLTGDGNVGIGTGLTTPAFKLQVNGTAGKPGGGSWSVASDIRLKKDIEEFTDGLDVLTKIHTISFNYNGKAGYPTDERYVGVIAQEIKEIAPYMISEIKADDGEIYLQFDPSAMDFITVNAIKEQQKIIIEQEKRINELENRLNKIESLLEGKRYTQTNFN